MPSVSIPEQVDTLFYTLTALSAVLTIGIFGAIIYFCTRYHHSVDIDRKYSAAGQWKLELTWTVLPLIILIFIAIWGSKVYLNMFSPPLNAIEVFVVGKQWMWKFQHPDGLREVGELHVPVGQPILLTMTSEDVIHNLFIPNFRIKQDVLPGRYTATWFEATQPGIYPIYCTEYCGTEHAAMGNAHLIAMRPNDYQTWVNSASTAGNSIPVANRASQGRELFKKLTCASCHFNQVGGQAPRLEGIYHQQETLEGGARVLVDENYLRESIIDPNAKLVQGFQSVMPSYKGLITEEQILEIISYIKSLQYSQRQGLERK